MIQPPVSALELVLGRLAVSHGWPVHGPGGPGIERHRAGPGRVYLELMQMQAAPISPDGVVSFGKLRGKQIMAHRAVDFVAEVSTWLRNPNIVHDFGRRPYNRKTLPPTMPVAHQAQGRGPTEASEIDWTDTTR
jgi:hypothetical protein